MPDEAIETRTESGRRDDGVHLDPVAVVEDNGAALESRHPGDDPDAPVPHRVRGPDVDDGDHAPSQELGVGLCGSNEAIRGQIRDRDPADAGNEPVQHGRR